MQCVMFNALQWNCFNLVYTCNIALILFFKCDVTKFRIPPPFLSHNVTLRWPPPPLKCDVIYGWPLIILLNCFQADVSTIADKYIQSGVSILTLNIFLYFLQISPLIFIFFVIWSSRLFLNFLGGFHSILRVAKNEIVAMTTPKPCINNK